LATTTITVTAIGWARRCCKLYAYGLLTNPVHLLMTLPEPQAVSRLVISLEWRCVQYINRAYRRTGTLRDSRHKSSLARA